MSGFPLRVQKQPPPPKNATLFNTFLIYNLKSGLKQTISPANPFSLDFVRENGRDQFLSIPNTTQ